MEEERILAKRFMNAYNRRTELYKQKSRLGSAIHTKLIEQRALEKAIELNKEPRHEDQSKPSDQTTMFGTGIHRLSLVSIGTLPTENLDLLHTETAIYPVGYTCRKKYRKHNSYKKKAKDKILYVCSVDPQKGPVIIADDGREWSGPNMWEDLVGSIDGMTEYKSLEEFFGFGNPALVKKIEALGDISVFKKYIPWDKREKA